MLTTSLTTTTSLAEDFTLYLVRHAEKQSDRKDPSLTRCGMLRANQLAEMLKHIEINAVYSTHYKRTMATARPTANAKNVSVIQYAPNGLEQLVRTLKAKQQNALVVGHSNTTPQLVALLTGNNIVPMTEKEYQHFFQIQISGKKVTAVDITQPLRCN
ncbi:histidine phosphatase family protein [Thalassotalea sp. M1531]|uniref:Histidine phosphatase family protein n=2 Tax=Thalassotalea algicola TaxID=2716224 RepID=A0A7Y0Q7F8_9GAMM|nr:histidine phosphatase family protein [Thalassotalea algicola]